MVPDGPKLDDKVVFRFNLGFGLDGAQPSSQPSLNGSTCLQEAACRAAYTQNRIYGFGDVVLGSRGLLAQNLAGYFAAQFRFDQGVMDGSSAVPSVYDGDTQDVQMRSAYGEVDGLFGTRLYLRAGRQYRYGAGLAHFDGLTASYDARAGSIGVFGGTGVDLYGPAGGVPAEDGGTLAGLTLRLDLAALGWGPVVLTSNTLGYDRHAHGDVAAAVRIRRHTNARVRLRHLDGALAQADLQVRARLSAVTMAVLDLDHDTARDWRYDGLLVAPARAFEDGSDPRKYLNLEPPGPRTYLSLRAGTVLLDNVDLLVRGAVAVEHEDGAAPDERVFASSYVEGGAALEVRLQRTLSLALSGMARRHRADLPEAPGDPTDGAPDPLSDNLGRARVASFFESGAVARYTEGARIFSAEAELYARFYERMLLYSMGPLSGEDDRIGGRVSAEGWAGERLRLRVEYEATALLDSIPELRGFKSLRLMLEGRF